MAASRAFYVVQGELSVHSQGSRPGTEALSFADNDEGLRAFEEYLSEHAVEPVAIIVDVIEEVFATDSVPGIGRNDRVHLLDRRLRRKFPRTPFRLSRSVGGIRVKTERPVVHSAISNHELLDPWLSRIESLRVPLLGIYSVPLLTPQVFKGLYNSAGSVLYVSQHQGDKLRQTFVQEGLVKSSRFSQSPYHGDAAYARFVATEIHRSRRYLERGRLLSSLEPLDICVISDADTAKKVVESTASDSPSRFHFIDIERAARKLRAGVPVAVDQAQELFIDSAIQRRPSHSYAVSGEDRYWHMSRMRRAIIGAACVVAAVNSVVAGVYFGDAWRLHGESAVIDSQVRQLSETYRREHDRDAEIKADSYEMKLAVDTGDFILRQRVPVPWVMQQLGGVLNHYPDVRLSHLSWQARTELQARETRPRPGEPAKPVPIPEVSAVAADITASIEPFEGDLRDAFTRIDDLVASIKRQTAFTDTVVLEYPVDARLSASVTGEISRESRSRKAAAFRLQLRYPLAGTAASPMESRDDPI